MRRRHHPFIFGAKAANREVSSHASNYFQVLREQHARMLTENLSPVAYSKLSPKDAP